MMTTTFEQAIGKPAQSRTGWRRVSNSTNPLSEAPGINVAQQAVDRHVLEGRGHHVALRWLRKDGVTRDLHYADLMSLSNRFANVLTALGVEPGTCVASLTGQIPAWYAAAFGSLKNRSVFCPLSPALDGDSLAKRLALGPAEVLVVPLALYEEKIRQRRPELPALKHVIVIDDAGDPRPPAGVHDWLCLIQNASERFTIPSTSPTDGAFLHFTAGAADETRGVLHAHRAALMPALVGRRVFGLAASDTFWSSAEPGTSASTFDGTLAPLLNGATLLAEENEFAPEQCGKVLAQQSVQVWHTTPDVVRGLIASGLKRLRTDGQPGLRVVSSGGEPLDAHAVLWSKEVLGQPVHDTWSQTETGGILIANQVGADVRPGSSGRALPGIECAIVARRSDRRIGLLPDGARGELAVRAGWPSMFQGYLGARQRYAACFAGGWYLTGAMAHRESDGTYWFDSQARLQRA